MKNKKNFDFAGHISCTGIHFRTYVPIQSPHQKSTLCDPPLLHSIRIPNLDKQRPVGLGHPDILIAIVIVGITEKEDSHRIDLV
jgi:hypothetical protein